MYGLYEDLGHKAEIVGQDNLELLRDTPPSDLYLQILTLKPKTLRPQTFVSGAASLLMTCTTCTRTTAARLRSRTRSP